MKIKKKALVFHNVPRKKPYQIYTAVFLLRRILLSIIGMAAPFLFVLSVSANGNDGEPPSGDAGLRIDSRYLQTDIKSGGAITAGYGIDLFTDKENEHSEKIRQSEEEARKGIRAPLFPGVSGGNDHVRVQNRD